MNLNVTSFDDNGQLIDSGYTAIRVVNLEGSAYNTNAQFDQDLNINVDANAVDTVGLYVSGDSSSSEDLHAGVNVDGNLKVNIKGASSYIDGIYAQGESGVTAGKLQVTIDSRQSDATVYGVHALTNPTSYPGPGYVNVTNGIEMDISGKGNLVGLSSSGAFDDRGSNISSGGSSVIKVQSEDGNAVGVEVQDGANTSLSATAVEVASNAADKTVLGFDLDAAKLSLSGHNTVKAAGTNGVGLDVNDSTVIISGSLSSQAQTALNVADTNSVINVAGQDNASGLLSLNGNVANAGQINLTKSELAVSGTTKTAELGSINTLGNEESSVTLAGGNYHITEFSGAEKSLVLTDLANTDAVSIDTKNGKLRMRTTGNSNDQYANVTATADALLKTVSITTDNDTTGNRLDIDAGAVNDSLSAKIGENGALSEVKITKNDKLQALGSISALSALSLRHELSILTQRMGELRDSAHGTGVWTRAYGSEIKYGSLDVTNRSNSIQVGADHDIGDFKVGAAFNYTKGDASYDKGDADSDNYGIALYGTWFDPSGLYVDLIAKYSRLNHDFALNCMDGSYDSDAFNVSAETGYNFALNDKIFIEPQVGIAYSFISGEQFRTGNGVLIDQDDYNSLIGRVGLRSGLKLPDNKGTIYARIAGVYDFDGELDANAQSGKAFNTINEDLGGKWWEMGLGANISLSENAYTYIDFERTSGGEVKENYRWNVGVRYTF